MKFKDCTSYSKYDKKRRPTTFAWQGKNLRIVITKGHIDAKGEWVMHCHAVGINTFRLNVPTKKEAEEKAIWIVEDKLRGLLSELPK